MAEVITGLCESCKELKPIAWTDSVLRQYCAECLLILPVPTAYRLMDFLMHTIPFRVGDRVEARTAGALLDGVGVIDEISFDPAKFGTPVYPSFHVAIEQKAYPEAPDALWYLERCLTRVES